MHRKLKQVSVYRQTHAHAHTHTGRVEQARRDAPRLMHTRLDRQAHTDPRAAPPPRDGPSAGVLGVLAWSLEQGPRRGPRGGSEGPPNSQRLTVHAVALGCPGRGRSRRRPPEVTRKGVRASGPRRAAAASDLHVLLHTELRQRLLDAQRCEAGRAVGVPALTHHLPHHAQRLRGSAAEHRPECPPAAGRPQGTACALT